MKSAKKFFISAGITLVIMMAISFGIPDPEQAHSTRIAGIIFAAVIAAIPIYDIDHWSLAKRTVAHFLAMSVTVFPCLVFSGWFDTSTPAGYMSIVATFLAFGLVGWIIGYSVDRLSKKTKPARVSEGR